MERRRPLKSVGEHARADTNQRCFQQGNGATQPPLREGAKDDRSTGARVQRASIPMPPPMCFVPDSSPTSWKDVCMLGRNLEDNCKLSSIQPSKTIAGDSYTRIEKSKIDASTLRWENTLIGYVLGENPTICILRLVSLDYRSLVVSLIFTLERMAISRDENRHAHSHP